MTTPSSIKQRCVLECSRILVWIFWVLNMTYIKIYNRIFVFSLLTCSPLLELLVTVRETKRLSCWLCCSIRCWWVTLAVVMVVVVVGNGSRQLVLVRVCCPCQIMLYVRDWHPRMSSWQFGCWTHWKLEWEGLGGRWPTAWMAKRKIDLGRPGQPLVSLPERQNKGWIGKGLNGHWSHCHGWQNWIVNALDGHWFHCHGWQHKVWLGKALDS